MENPSVEDLVRIVMDEPIAPDDVTSTLTLIGGSKHFGKLALNPKTDFAQTEEELDGETLTRSLLKGVAGKTLEGAIKGLRAHVRGMLSDGVEGAMARDLQFPVDDAIDALTLEVAARVTRRLGVTNSDDALIVALVAHNHPEPN